MDHVHHTGTTLGQRIRITDEICSEQDQRKGKANNYTMSSSNLLVLVSNVFTNSTIRRSSSALLHRSCSSSVASRLTALSNNTSMSNSNIGSTTSISSARCQYPVMMVRRMMVTSNTIGGEGGGGGGKDNNDDDKKGTNSGRRDHVQNDPYGVHYHDGDQGVGPEEQLPPRYKRDPTTGLTTAAYHTELTSEDQRLLKLTRREKVQIYQKRVEESFLDVSSTTSNVKEQRLLDAISSDDKEKSTAIRERHPDRKEWEKLRKRYFYMLKEREKRARERFYEKKQRHMTEPEKKYRTFLQSQGLIDDEEEEEDKNIEKEEDEEGVEDTFYGVPTYESKKQERQQQEQQKLEHMEHPDKFPSNPWEDENLAWVAQDVSLYSQDDIFMPPELSRLKKVNRKLATPIPKGLLHHNNLDLLRRCSTPGGQIKNRIHTRLGAKDQRKIAKLIKRARAMGLIPYSGQWKVKDDGDMFDPTLDQKKDWEQVYEDAGLIADHSYYHTKKAPFTKEEEDYLLRKAQSLGIQVDADGNLPLLEELKKLEQNLMVDSKTLLAQFASREDSGPLA